MRILPVLDVRSGQVVHAVGGRREEYRPIQSDLCESVLPTDIAEAIRRETGVDELYLADLTGIAGAHPSWPMIWKLHEAGFHLWVDAGVSSLVTARVIQANTEEVTGLTIIVASEWIESEHQFREAIRRFGSERLAFSLDLRGGRVRSRIAAWRKMSPVELFEHVYDLGIVSFVVLDVATIADSSGCQTLDLCRQLRDSAADVQLVTGGGVRTIEHLRAAHEAGVDGVLVASAIHTRQIGRAEIAEVGAWSE